MRAVIGFSVAKPMLADKEKVLGPVASSGIIGTLTSKLFTVTLRRFIGSLATLG